MGLQKLQRRRMVCVVGVDVGIQRAHIDNNCRCNPHTGQPYAWLVRSTAFINYFYFYCVDEDFGPFFVVNHRDAVVIILSDGQQRHELHVGAVLSVSAPRDQASARNSEKMESSDWLK